MSYLYPPPEPAPVVVVKDVGGLVSDYRDRTEMYRAQNREVRLHECRSACTLALSLPNVCVYPDAQLKFHQAYNDITKETDLGISDELWRSYPQAVRARLGALTRKYQIIGGRELIAMGIRDCTAPQERIMVAKARPAPQPQKEEGTMLAGLGSALTSLVTPTPPAVVQTRPVAEPPRPPAAPPNAAVPEPVPRPAEPDLAEPHPAEPPPSIGTNVDVPLPPPRPPLIGKVEPAIPPFQRPIAGSQRILPPRFVTLASLR